MILQGSDTLSERATYVKARDTQIRHEQVCNNIADSVMVRNMDTIASHVGRIQRSKQRSATSTWNVGASYNFTDEE